MKRFTSACALIWILLAINVRADDNVHYIVPTRKLAYLDMQFRQLMLDEYVVDRFQGVQKVYPQAQPLGRPLLECEGPHELESMSLSMPSVIYDRDTNKHRMWWYNIWDIPREQRYKYGALCYAESADGLNWIKPELGQLDYKGHGTANNCIAGVGNSQWTTSVVLGHDGQFRSFLTPHETVAVLENGIRVVQKQRFRWNQNTNMAEGRRVVGGLVSDLYHVMYDPMLKRYLATVRTFAPLAGSKQPAKWRRAVSIYTSQNGVDWKSTGRLLQTDTKYDEYVEQLTHRKRKDLAAWGELHDVPIQRYEGLIIGLNGILFFYDEDLARQREIAGTETAYFLGWSHDGVNWSRPFERKPLIDMPYGTDSWGRHTIGSSFMMVHQKELWIYHDVGRGHTNRTYKTPKPKQISLAKLRRDGFAGYQAGQQGGWLQTAPFVASGKLKLNANAVDGEVRVEVLAVNEESEYFGKRSWQPLEKFSTRNCQPLSGDSFEGVVEWENADWSELEGRTVALRVHLNNATLYSFWTRTKPNRAALVNLVE